MVCSRARLNQSLVSSKSLGLPHGPLTAARSSEGSEASEAPGNRRFIRRSIVVGHVQFLLSRLPHQITTHRREWRKRRLAEQSGDNYQRDPTGCCTNW